MARQTWCFSALAAVLLTAPALPVAAPVTGTTSPRAKTEGRSGAQILGAVPEPSSQMVEQIHQEEEAILTGTHWSYDPAGRRDPFRSLVEQVSIKGHGERPKGITGMLITEVDLVGIVTGPKGDLVFLNGSDNRGYFLGTGDSLYDGTIVSIDRGAGQVVFRQEVDDPREIKPYRDVVKNLYSSTEDGQ
ncbi:MAG: hypothetical protein ACE5HD_00140 [Acidobacteriota bacterium]